MTGRPWIAPREGGYTGDGTPSSKPQPPTPTGRGAASAPQHPAAAAERAALLRLAEELTDLQDAVEAALLGHSRDNVIGWSCGCGHKGRLGEGHARHQAAAVLDLLRRRAGGAT